MAKEKEKTKKKKVKPEGEKTKKVKKTKKPAFRSLLGKGNKLKPIKEIFAGFEIEKRWLLATVEEDFYTKGDTRVLHDTILREGTRIKQGYIKDMGIAREMLDELGIDPEFKPNTVRLRKYSKEGEPTLYVLTLKDRKESKKREVEWELKKKTFENYWPLTEGARIHKVRLKKKVKGYTAEFDAFTDRFLIIAEIEVQDEKEMAKLPKLGMDITGQKDWTNKSLSK